MKNKLTPNRAAALTRQNVVRKIRQMVKRNGCKHSQGYLDFAEELIAWLREMDVRQNKRKGGLGRR